MLKGNFAIYFLIYSQEFKNILTAYQLSLKYQDILLYKAVRIIVAVLILCLLFFDAIRLIPQENAHFCEVKHAKSKNERIFFLIVIKGTDLT